MITKIKGILRTLLNYLYDFKLYLKFNGSNAKNLDPVQLEGKIIAHYHVLEKGMSHFSPKEGFSLPVAINLNRLLFTYLSISSQPSQQVITAISVLKKYAEFKTIKRTLPQNLKNSIDELVKLVAIIDGVGRIEISKKEFLKNQHSSFDQFAFSRFTLRSFTNQEVSMDIIDRAVLIAMKSPSVCNRQTSKVTVVCEKQLIAKVLSLQNGNRGFGEKINKLLIITSDLKLFEGPRERNQPFVDGGIFLMSLLYGLHFEGIGAVTLNWAYDYKQDKTIHRLNIIDDSEKVIALVGVGHIPNCISIAASTRRELKEVLKYV